MSTTFLQRFYETAKQAAEAPALWMETEGRLQSFPWWFVKSRVKHFGMGLLEAGAKPGDYFYLLPSRHPTWVYSELGALSMGLRTVPLPAGLTSPELERLFAEFPPRFVYWGDGFSTDFPWRDYGTLKALVTKSEDPVNPVSPVPPFLTFRQIFNNGIQFESKHYAAYRSIRESLGAEDCMSPIRIDRAGAIVFRPLLYGEVDAALARFSRIFQPGKARRIFSEVNFWWTEGRWLSVYWPLFSAMQCLLGSEHSALSGQLRAASPDLIFLDDARLLQLEREWGPRLAEPSPQKAPGSNLGAQWRAFRQKYWVRRQLGGKTRLFVGAATLPPLLQHWLSAAKVRVSTLAELGELPL